ncbi:MAG: ATP-binding cassette domain-containing protein [Rhizobiales bacterium]|nr:ATP-binding cassette domain-containing protein [Hyphomicrobiales bacterium]
MRAPDSDLPIVLDGVTVQAGAVTILDRLSLRLEAGAPTVLVGPNGSGKTTLLRVAMGLLRPTGGRVIWGGREQVPPVRRAFVFQRPVMLRRSAMGNVRYALATAGVARAERAARVADLLNRVGLADRADRPARRLSGGEQQRLAIARALARSPAVLFLDEPTASLDPAATKAIEDLVGTIAASRVKIVMATHDLGSARRLVGNVVLMHRGRVIEAGPAATFFTSPQTDEARRFIAGELLV